MKMNSVGKLTTVALLLACLCFPFDHAYARSLHRRNARKLRPTRATNCQDVAEADLSKKLELELSLNLPESFYQLDGLREASEDESLAAFQRDNRGPVDIRRAPIGDDSADRPDCDHPVPRSTPAGNITDPCPYIHVLNVDQNRYPSILVEAQCLPCSSCMSAGLTSSDRDVKGLVDRTQCQKVTYVTRVLRKTHRCEQGSNSFRYEPVWEPISVGCACRAAPAKESGTGKPEVHK